MTAATRDLIKVWVEDAKAQGALFTIIACDTFDYEDYPVHVMPNEDFWEVLDRVSTGDMVKVHEVYNLSQDIEEQLNMHRAWNVPPKEPV